MLLADALDLRFDGKSATSVRLDGVTVWPKPKPVPAAFSGGGALSATAVKWTPLSIPGLAVWIDPAQDKAAYGPNENLFTGNPDISEVGDYTIGCRFQPTATGRITHIRANVVGGSHTFTLWTDAGVRLSSIVDVSSGPREWRSVALPAPVDVVAGTIYHATFSTNGVAFGRGSGAVFPSETPNVTLISNGYNFGVDVLPAAGSGASHYGVDVVYQKAGKFSDNQAISSYTSYDPSGRVIASPTTDKPTFRTAAVGGKPRIFFDRLKPTMRFSTDNYNPGTTGLTYVFVGQTDIFTSNGMMLTWSNDHIYEFRNINGEVLAQGDGVVTQTTFARSPNVDYVIMLHVDMVEKKLRIYINDTEKAVIASKVAMPNVARTLHVGCRYDGWIWHGLMAEALVISGPISAADRAKLMTYMRAKHSAFPAVP